MIKIISPRYLKRCNVCKGLGYIGHDFDVKCPNNCIQEDGKYWIEITPREK